MTTAVVISTLLIKVTMRSFTSE